MVYGRVVDPEVDPDGQSAASVDQKLVSKALVVAVCPKKEYLLDESRSRTGESKQRGEPCGRSLIPRHDRSEGSQIARLPFQERRPEVSVVEHLVFAGGLAQIGERVFDPDAGAALL
jgi:hypothetical protein